MELKEWLDLLVVPGIFIGGLGWFHRQIKAEWQAVRDEARTACDNIGQHVGMVREAVKVVREDVRRVDSKVDGLAKETRHLHRAVGQLAAVTALRDALRDRRGRQGPES